jgi:hypothetical protein
MTKRLSEGDRRAVDLLLDRAAVGSGKGNGNGAGDGDGAASASGGDTNGGGGGYVSHAGTVDEQRVSAVSRVLHLLDNLPAGEPPDDLLARTLRRLGEPMPAMMQPTTAGGFPPRPSQQQQQQPHA